MKKELEITIKKAVLDLFKIKQADFSVDYPAVEKFGDYTTNAAMVLAKFLRESPMEIAESLKLGFKNLKKPSFEGAFEKIEIVAPGYINFYLSQKYLQDKVAEINEQKENFGNSKKKKEKIMVEYSQPNTHKEFHIGHLRNVFLGSALVKVLKKSGSEILSANYIGDTGTHVAKCLWGLTKFYSEENIEKSENKGEFLGKVYARAVKEIEDNPDYEKEFKDVQKKFEAGDGELVSLWEKTRRWSLDDFEKIYKELGVQFDVYFYESEEEIEGKKMVPILMEKGVAEKSNGALIADLEKYGLDILVLQRSDGSVLYGLKDLPLADKKFAQYKIDKSIIVTDIRQHLYFKQIFKILELLGLKKDMAHIGYEFVTLKGGEGMSSRKGNVISARELIAKVTEKVKIQFPQAPNLTEISLGAIKFFMLKYSDTSIIEFNIDESVRIEGATGPYVQYAHARIFSILRKAESFKLKSENLNLLTHEKELSLIKELNKFPELVEEIAENYEVHRLPHYAIKLADKFHSFYSACRVIDAENPELSSARLNLVNAVRIVLTETLRLIGVSSPEKM